MAVIFKLKRYLYMTRTKSVHYALFRLLQCRWSSIYRNRYKLQFERNFCQWENSRPLGFKFAWIRNKGETIMPKTGLSYYHTYQNPHYSHCLRFWYNMNGADVSRLQVVSSTLKYYGQKKISIAGYAGESYEADIDIDNIT
ncbi:uncharacterized protein TRIADDRAFT_53231 [Trichoplax adhaerens]|uniref:MAM domain-containing protein n=1 Tax=Trichoplax adhaerens TaxID=10228 RepID=B3RNN6_TRIAD|nr:hypothetical protein TRIADDRAFT_53231 [Trichoplax adhaerens]EDV27488.1 hypothetical protein TRIADDRAFT_53231 [Trichoplax adhaerens]|eukprot:XP_002109322.1 hypothetical protein TRIADDRAFT_53231 [Trichoplax adhaerens]